jgi:hypothetical protein
MKIGMNNEFRGAGGWEEQLLVFYNTVDNYGLQFVMYFKITSRA